MTRFHNWIPHSCPRNSLWKTQIPMENISFGSLCSHLLEAWILFMDRSCQERTFQLVGRTLVPTGLVAPQVTMELRQIVVLSPGGSKRAVHGGPWTEGNLILTQYKWKDGTPLLNTSTAKLREGLNINCIHTHPSIQKWETELGCRLPNTIWEETCLGYPFKLPKKMRFFGRSYSGHLLCSAGGSPLSLGQIRRFGASDVQVAFGKTLYIASGVAHPQNTAGDGAKQSWHQWRYEWQEYRLNRAMSFWLLPFL